MLADLAAGDATELEPLQDDVNDALRALDAGTIWFTFRSIGRRAFAELTAAHPAGDDDHAMAQAMGGTRAAYCLATLGPALVLASCVSPVLDTDLVEEIFDGTAWNESEIASLVASALDANTQARTVRHRTPPQPQA